MNEDQLIDAAEREMDLYRDEITRLRAAHVAEIMRLRADIADAEAEIARWPRCPAGCRCRVGTDDADALECGCDGPCTAGWDAPAAAEAVAVEAETGKVRKVVRELISMFHGISGGYGARTSFRRLSRLAAEAGVEPPQPGQPLSAAIADELGTLHKQLEELAVARADAAMATAPSKKSDIEAGCANAIWRILDGTGAGTAGV